MYIYIQCIHKKKLSIFPKLALAIRVFTVLYKGHCRLCGNVHELHDFPQSIYACKNVCIMTPTIKNIS